MHRDDNILSFIFRFTYTSDVCITTILVKACIVCTIVCSYYDNYKDDSLLGQCYLSLVVEFDRRFRGPYYPQMNRS